MSQQAPSHRATERNTVKSPIMVTDCAKAVRAADGGIYLLQKFDYGFVLRCEFGPKQFRVILPPIVAGAYPDVPHEANSPTFIVHDITALTEWLRAKRPTSPLTHKKSE